MHAVAHREPSQTIPRPEYPRPDYQRDHWVNLNGRWRFAFDPQNVGEQLRWYRCRSSGQRSAASMLVEDPFRGEIIVPFPWESQLSGVGDTAYLGAAWYQRTLEAPAAWAATLPNGDSRWRYRPFLCFGAVDWHARVWIDGRFVGEHTGGYTPFSLDLSPHLRPGRPASLVVRVWDVCDADTPIGKQTVRWYTHSSGIWQPVWLEGRPAVSLGRLHIRPVVAEGRAEFTLELDAPRESAGQPVDVTVTSDDGAFPTIEREFTAGSTTELPLDIRIPAPRAWSPEEPHLYPCTITVRTGEREDAVSVDIVHTYFGLRSIGRARWDGRPYEYVLLNDKPIYLRGALDQAFHPEGLYSYPTDDAIRADIEAAKSLGLNMLRCHIKVNDPRYYYWADRLGMLLFSDLPSCDLATPSSRSHWEATFRATVERDDRHPSIIAWVLFNETWGLGDYDTPESWAWVGQMVELAKSLDPTRLVEDNSPCLYDHVVTDLNSWHFYIAEYDRARRHVEHVVNQTAPGSTFNYVGQGADQIGGNGSRRIPWGQQQREPLLNSEYAGLSARQGDRDIAYSFKFLTTELRRHDKICGFVYTELTDLEWEHNGLLNYDRSRKEFGYDAFMPKMSVADLTGPDCVGLDCPPCQTLPPGGRFVAQLFVSHWSSVPIGRGHVRWNVSLTDRFGTTTACAQGSLAVAPRQYGVTDVGRLDLVLPDEPGLVTIGCALVAEDGVIRGRNYSNVDLFAPPGLAPIEQTAIGHAVRFLPGDFAVTSWPDPRLAAHGEKFSCRGAGWVEYRVPVPDNLDLATVGTLRLQFEAGACTHHQRIDWRDPRYVLATDYPQTEALKLPTQIDVSIDGQSLGRIWLPDDPADARGVLSAHLSPGWEPSSYGYLTAVTATPEVTRTLLNRLRGRDLVVRFEVPVDGIRGGISLYGARLGATPVAPTLFFDRLSP